ncbi:Uncharacterized conserved protein, DUF1697 family [Reichenbachiella faecimaris]|uniref:Uncharacterized conserved protein, DUF1697 family n=1 Tax=Reichenbachiella faecimaris TaxID=692418 RepID=A0A1W2GJ12_REIFA|nr:DUF1697 domain-containing protein [Reichenbachiella faecimaris]SMD36653.1 Uncharacterized conserved protein, DUF1697 family [Reichenbachiella faecimaris]
MAKYIALLRGINVSGQKLIKMDALRTSLSKLKYENIQTYIQSGNIIFESSETDQRKLEDQIHQNIQDSFGFDVPVIVRSQAEWRTTFNNNPFVNDRNEDITKLYVTLLSDEPKSENFEVLLNFRDWPEEMILKGQNLYIFYTMGAGTSKLDLNTIERKLKVQGTSRNWKTTTKLMQMLDD